jgi:hypothetical protein
MWSVASMFARTGYGTLVSRQLARATGNRLVLGAKRAEDVNRSA